MELISTSCNYDLRFICYMPEFDLSAVIQNRDNRTYFFEQLRSFADKSQGFISFLNDASNYRNSASFNSGLGVLNNMMMEIGCKKAIYYTTQLQAAVRMRNADLRNELIATTSEAIAEIASLINTIPIAEPAEAARQNCETLSGTLDMLNRSEPTRRPVILVLDNSPEVLSSVESALSECGTIYPMLKSDMLIKFLQITLVDLFIFDVELMGLDGYALFSIIRKRPEYQTTPIMFLTGNATAVNIKAAMEIGVDGFVRKPYDPEHLRAKVVDLLKKSEKRVYK